MQGVKAKCETLCQMKKYGGRCVYIDEKTLRILDIEKWTAEMSEEIHHFIPNVSIDIFAHPKSLTGFCVEIKKKTVPVMHFALAVCIMAICILSIHHIRTVWAL